MTATAGNRIIAVVVATLLALGSTMSAAQASGDHTPPTFLPPPPTPTSDDHTHQVDTPPIGRSMSGGNVRQYVDGQSLSYRMRVTQRLQARALYESEPVSGTLDMVLTETVAEQRGRTVVTLEVTEATAEGFLAEAEAASAQGRKVVFMPEADQLTLVMNEGADGEPDLLDLENLKPFGDLGAIRMVDMAIRAHLLNPVIPSQQHAEGANFVDNAAFPAGWTPGFQTLTGSLTAGAAEQLDGRQVVRMNSVHISTDTLLRIRAMDNAREALQGLEPPVPNDFFAGTMFDALFPEGSTYESLLPPLPLSVTIGERRRPAARRRTDRSRPRGRRLVLGCLMVLILASCSQPARNVDIVSLNLFGRPIQINHQSVVDQSSGVVISSEVTASATLTGEVYPIAAEFAVLLPQEVQAVSSAPLAMDAEWTISQELQSDLPDPGFALAGMIVPAGGAIALGLLAALLFRRRKGGKPEAPAAEAPAAEAPAAEAPAAEAPAAEAPPAPEETP